MRNGFVFQDRGGRAMNGRRREDEREGREEQPVRDHEKDGRVERPGATSGAGWTKAEMASIRAFWEREGLKSGTGGNRRRRSGEERKGKGREGRMYGMVWYRKGGEGEVVIGR